MANDSNANPWKALGYLFLGLGTMIEWRAWAQSKQLAGMRTRRGLLAELGSTTSSDVMAGDDERAVDALGRASGPILDAARIHSVGSIDQRVSYIRERINKDSLNPSIREAALEIVGKKCGTKGNYRWCTTPKDYAGEVKAIYAAVQDPNSPIALRYVRDHQKVDQFTAAAKAIKLRGEDCDGGTIVLGSLLMAIGYPIRMRVIQDTHSSDWSHIYPMVGLPPSNPSLWIPLDWSMYPFKPAGWQAPGADQAKATGRPAGIVSRVRDYDV